MSSAVVLFEREIPKPELLVALSESDLKLLATALAARIVALVPEGRRCLIGREPCEVSSWYRFGGREELVRLYRRRKIDPVATIADPAADLLHKLGTPLTLAMLQRLRGEYRSNGQPAQ